MRARAPTWWLAFWNFSSLLGRWDRFLLGDLIRAATYKNGLATHAEIKQLFFSDMGCQNATRQNNKYSQVVMLITSQKILRRSH